jgi:hypothetical protein
MIAKIAAELFPDALKEETILAVMTSTIGPTAALTNSQLLYFGSDLRLASHWRFG